MAYTILCVDDEREVLDALAADLQSFEKAGFVVELASSVVEAREVVAVLAPNELALVLCDHLMPGTTGVDFLVELLANDNTKATKKVLVTGQASLQDTVKAVNFAKIDHYIAKPWKGNELAGIVKKLLTDYVVELDEEPQKYALVLDFARVMEAARVRSL